MNLKDIVHMDEQYLLQNYNKLPVCFVKGHQEFLTDSEGKEYIDLLSGIATVSLGHAHPAVCETIIHQSQTLMHTSNLFFNQEQAVLAKKIAEKTPFPGRSFFCSTGTEANEAALKLMRAYGQGKSPKKTQIITLKQSFHGRTLGAMNLTGQEKVQSGYGFDFNMVTHITPNSIEELEAAFHDNTCGILMEPILGEGGVLPLEKAFAKKAQELCKKYDAVLAIDEIQAGAGRTGKLYGHQHLGITPDLITMAKGLGGGAVIGAVFVGKLLEKTFSYGMHGTTFGGNHLACAVASSVWDIISDESFLEEVAQKGVYLEDLLKKIRSPKVLFTRGIGLMQAVAIDEAIPVRPIVETLLKKGVVVGSAGGNCLRLVPALTISKQSLDKACAIIKEVLEAL